MSQDTLFFQRRTETAFAPSKATEGSAGFDLKSPEECEIPGRGWKKISTGLSFEFPSGTYGGIASRSSLASLDVITDGGVIDGDYRGCVVVLLINLSDAPFNIKAGDRIGQMIIEKCSYPRLAELHVGNLSRTERGESGFGSSGK